MKSPLDLETKSDKAISSENLSKKSSESTPLRSKLDKQFNEKDLMNLTRDNEYNKEYFNGIKQDDFNRACEMDDIEFVPHFQRVYISGDDNSGVCFLVHFGDLPGELFGWMVSIGHCPMRKHAKTAKSADRAGCL